MRALSSTALQAINSETTSECFLWLVDLSHPDMTTLRITNNLTSIVSNGNTYVYWPFVFTPADDKEQSNYTAQFVIDNIDPLISRALRSLVGSPTITVSMILGSEPDTILYGPVSYEVVTAPINIKKITANLKEKSVFVYSTPWTAFTPQAFPGFGR